MIVKIRNLDIFERSVPTPVNTSIPIHGNEAIEFEYPKAYDWFFLNLRKFHFDVEVTLQPGDVHAQNPNLNYVEFNALVNECLRLLRETEVCNDGGIHVSPEDLWVTESVYDEFKTAYEQALKVKQEANSQDMVDEMVATLTEHKTKFENARQTGTSVDEMLSKVTQYGFSEDGVLLGPVIGLDDVKDNSFFVKLDKPLRDEDEIVASLTIEEHQFDTDITVDRHPTTAGRSVTTIGETVAWSLGTSKDDTDIDRVDGKPVAKFDEAWPIVPNTALLTMKTSDGEIMRGSDEHDFVDKQIDMNKGTVTNVMVTSLNFTYLDEAIVKAKKTIEGVLTSEDGEDVEPGTMWVTEEQMTAITDEIAKAEGLKGTVDDQLAINDELVALENATALFESQKQDGRKGPFISAVTLLDGEDAQAADGTKLYHSGFDVKLNGDKIVAKGILSFIEDMGDEPSRETHYRLPIGIETSAGRVVVVYDIDAPESEESHEVSEGTVKIALRVDDEHRETKIRVYKNEDKYGTEEGYQEYTVNCSQVTLADELPYITGVSVPEGMWEELMYSQMQENLAPVLSGNRVTATGDINYIEDWAAYDDEHNTHYFVPVTLEGLKPTNVVKCYVPGSDSEELKHYTVENDRVLVTAISPALKVRKITVFADQDNYDNDERGQDFILDFSGVTLKADPNPLKEARLLTESGYKGKQYRDLVAQEPPFTVELDDETHVIKCTGEMVWTDWPEVAGLNSATHHFLPMRLELADGLIFSWFATDTSPVESKHFTMSENTRDIVMQFTEGAPKKKFVVYTSMDAHNAQEDGVTYIIDCSEVVFQPKPFTLVPVEDEEGLKDALATEPDYDGNVHVQLTQPVEVSEELTIETPTVITGSDGSDTLTVDGGLNVLADLEIDDVEVTAKSENGIMVGDGTATPTVELNGVTFNFQPESANADGNALGIVVNTSAQSSPVVNITGSTITASPLQGKRVRAIEILSDSSVNGGGTVNLDSTEVTVSGTGNTAVVLQAPHSEVTIANGSTITNEDYEGILVGYDGKVTVDNSKIDAVAAVYIDSLAGCDTEDAVVEITNDSEVTSTNTWAASGANNTAAITIANAKNCTVHLDPTSSLTVRGGNTAHNNEYVGSFLGDEDNTIHLEGAVTSENNVNSFWFTHSISDTDGLYFDQAGNGDNIVVEGTAAAKAYIIDSAEAAMAIAIEDRSNTINVANDLKTAVTVAQKAQQGDSSKRFVINMGRFATDSGNDDVRMPAGVTFKGYSNFVTLSPVTSTVLGKDPKDFQHNVNVLENGMTAQVTGSLLDTDWADFSSVPSENEGHYLALKATKLSGVNGLSITNEHTGTKDKPLDDDGIFVLYISSDKSKKVILKADTNEGQREIRIDLTDIVLTDGPGTEVSDFFTVEAATGKILNMDMKDVQSDVVADVNGTTVDLSGTLHYIASWPEFSKSNKGNFVALQFNPTERAEKLVMKNMAGKEVTIDEDNQLVVNVVNDNPFTVVATDTDGSEHSVAFTVTGLVREPEIVKLFDVSIPSGETAFGNKTFADLQDITINGDKTVTGTVHYVKGLKINETDGEGLSGNYFAIDVSRNATALDQVTVQFRNKLAIMGTIDTDSDIVLIKALKSMEGAKLIVKQTRQSTKKVSFEETYDLSKLTFEPDPDSLAKITEVKAADQTHAWKGVTYSDVQSEDTVATLEGSAITMTGTLFQKDGWEAYEEENRNKWYPVVNIAVESDQEAVRFFKVDGQPGSVHTFEPGKPNDDIVFVVDEDTKGQVRKIKAYSSKGDAEADVNGREYTIDFSGMKLLSNETVDLTIGMSDQGNSWKGVSYSDIQSPESNIEIQGDTFKVTGTFYKVNGWSAFGADKQDIYYIANNVTRPQGSYVEGTDGRHLLATRLTDDIVTAFGDKEAKPTFTVYPSTEHQRFHFAGKTYTFDFSGVELVDPYVKLSINAEKTYDIDDPTKLGDYRVEGNVVKGTATKYAGSISTHENKPEKQTGYYISVVADPWDGVEVNFDDQPFVPLTKNGKVLLFLGQTKNNIKKISFKNTNANDHIDTFDFDITCTPDATIPSIDKIGYFATRGEFNEYAKSVGLDDDKMNVSDQVFYIHYAEPLDEVTDYVTMVDVNGHRYGVGHKHVEDAETLTYFSMKNGYQVDYVDGAVKTEENKACDLSGFHGEAKVSLYRVNGELDYDAYPEDMSLMAEMDIAFE